MKELAKLGDQISWSFISILPETWRSANLTVEYKLKKNGSFALSALIKSLDGSRELLTISDELADLLVSHRSYFENLYDKTWDRYILDVQKDMEGNWNANFNFEFND